ncbi:hydrogenase small subunit [Heliorestis convoluta]|uniref:[Ni/Fe] hydrogenase, small subunit n=1 Tax=Heliorestis convoluta TaxID=356322 RepID=A0A5Q2N5Y1_9FIRM|nr:hydrogenase small subunit [Heliorestis convoluta]QGG49036.1 [Ni/Fe] hydrogenase, small subunit [Heliorestis convoluta]
MKVTIASPREEKRREKGKEAANNLLEQWKSKAREGEKKKKLIWLELTGCAGNIISLLNGIDPGLEELLQKQIDLCYNNSLMTAEGDQAMKQLFTTADDEFILAVEGAVTTKDEQYNSIGRYQGRLISAMEAIQYLGQRAKSVIAVGTCATYGGISAAHPNPSGSISVIKALQNIRSDVISLPGCPSHPDWFLGTLAYLILYGTSPTLDSENRPILFYGLTIHDNCTRRSFFEKRIFARQLGEQTCMIALGCRGPITRTDCPTREWNSYLNWPIGANTPCIGCAHRTFPDGTSPFVQYERSATSTEASKENNKRRK